MQRQPESNQALKTVLEALLKLHPKRIDLSLERIERLLGALGNPETKIPPVIHIAGTNGKGSVTAFMRSILEAAGFRVHTYTSPHLVHFNERIRLAGKLIGNAALIDLLAECQAANDGAPITFFEITTAAAFLAFSKARADCTLLEVGLGGRLDATNVVRRPIISVLTPIHFDHRSYLGRTLGEIAGEKAGIIKTGIPVVLGPQPAPAGKVIRQAAGKLKAPVTAYGEDWTIEPEKAGGGRLIYTDYRGRLDLPRPKLEGEHQIQNAGIAVAALRRQGTLKVPEAAYRAGLDWARWPGRLQDLGKTRLAVSLPEGSRVFLDGGHNLAAAKVLKRHFARLDIDGAPFHLVVGMMQGKDVKAFLRPFTGLAETIWAVPIPDQEACYSAAEIASAAASVGLAGRVSRSVQAAVQAVGAVTKPGQQPVILITGSLFLAGSVLFETGLEPN